jgi:DNA-directed RNA polymerase specialized sigma24 family protein
MDPNMNSEGSISRCIGKLRAGDSDAATQKLWQRYFRRVVGLARKRLRDLPRAELDEEDIAVMALESLFRGIRDGQFPWLRDRHSIWPVLATIAARKAINQRIRLQAAKRADLHVRSNQELAEGSDRGVQHDELLGRELDPQVEAMLTEFYQCLYRKLPTDQLRRILRMKLASYTNSEIAHALDVAERTVERKCVLIREHARRLDIGNSEARNYRSDIAS